MLRNYIKCITSPPQSNLRSVHPLHRSSADKTSSKLLELHNPSMLSPFKTRNLCYRKDYRAMRLTAKSDNTHMVCC